MVILEESAASPAVSVQSTSSGGAWWRSPSAGRRSGCQRWGGSCCRLHPLPHDSPRSSLETVTHKTVSLCKYLTSKQEQLDLIQLSHTNYYSLSYPSFKLFKVQHIKYLQGLSPFLTSCSNLLFVINSQSEESWLRVGGAKTACFRERVSLEAIKAKMRKNHSGLFFSFMVQE